MNSRKMADDLREMRDKARTRLPEVSGPSRKFIALNRYGGGDWIPVSPALYETVEKLALKLSDCFKAILKYEDACRKY